jgi:hypothetical protein
LTAHRSCPPALRALALAAACLSLAGCVVNAARPYAGGAPDAPSGRAVAVVGLTVVHPSRLPQFKVVLDQYDIRRQAITGGCLTYTRIDADTPNAAAPTRFFAFDVPAGHYIYSGFNRTHEVGGIGFESADQAFAVPAGHAVYIGNFVLDGDKVALHSDLDGDRRALAQALPGLAATVEKAAAVTALPARPFLCAP